MKTIKFFLILATGALTACASTESKNVTTIESPIRHDQSEYESLVLKYSDQQEHNDGLYNIFTVRSTLINTSVLQAQVTKRAHDYQWTESHYQEERAKAVDLQKKQTQFFLSFYTPKRKHDDLTLGNSIWKVYLDVNGKRFTGQILKYDGVLEHTQSFFPDHTKYATPYMLSFPIGTEELDKFESKITITGPLGTETMGFKKL